MEEERPSESGAPTTPAARRTCYRKNCKHPECRAESNLYQKRIKADQIRGVSRKVPAERALRVIEMRKRELGWNPSVNELSRALGVSYRVISCLEKGQVKYVEANTFRRLMQPLNANPVYVPATATRLRIRALQADGWRVVDMTTMLNCSTELYATHAKVTYATAEKIIGAVRAWGDGPSTHGRKVALAKGWLPRSAYDQDLLLDPLWDGVGGVLDHGARRSREETLQEFWHLVENGLSPLEAAEALGNGRRWAKGAYKEAGRPLPESLIIRREVTA